MSQVQILIVEDENIIALDLRIRLNGLGYAVLAVAASGEEAIEKTTELDPDLILMDIRLRGEMDGIEAAQIIQARSDVPIVYLTALADEDTLKRAEATGVQGLIRKPFEDTELHTAIEAALDQSGASE
jgi:CheY-like chemotaxis protein